MKNVTVKALVIATAVLTAASIVIMGCGEKKNRESIAAVREEAVTSYVNLPNPNGSVTPVAIKRQGNVYIGPRGEQYTSYPTVEQLKPIYGVK